MRRLHPAIILLIVAILAYGLLIPQLGFYWDDLPMSWIRYQLGTDAMTEYFSTNRPVWALLYQITTRILPYQPVYWQVFALFWRWIGAVVVWAVTRRLFPRHALAVSLLFLLYPGFNQQWVSYLYSHFFIVLFFFLLSIHFMLRGRAIPALIFSALNLWMMEYFFVLELIRPFILWMLLWDEFSQRERIKRALSLWPPYLAVFSLAVFSRLFIFNNQIYGFSLKDEIAQTPIETIASLVQNVFSSLWVVTVSAWATVFQFPNPAVDGPRTTALYLAVVVAVAALNLLFGRNQVDGQERSAAREMILLGVVALFLGGPPFWLTDVPVSLGFPANRATLSFTPGVSFLFVGLLGLLPARARHVVLTAFIALAAGRQFLWSNEFRRDWTYQKNLFWQMTWRAPALEKDTIVLINEELKYHADNSLGAALNLIYAPDNHSSDVDYVLFYPTNRESLSLNPNTPVTYDFLAGKFSGNTSQTVVFYYAPPRCLRLLDPDIDSANKLIPGDSLLRDAALLSSNERIRDEAIARMPDFYGDEPARAWCYYFQKADLARQLGDWDQVTALGDKAFALDDYPNDPIERFVFVEGYAHTGDWDSAVKYSKASYGVSKQVVGPLLCRLWQRIGAETGQSTEKDRALSIIQKLIACDL